MEQSPRPPVRKRWPRAVTLLLLVAVGVPGGAGATEVPRELREAVADNPALATLLTNYTFRRSVVSTGRVLDRELHEFLLSNPHIGAALTRVQGLGSYRVRRVGPRVFEGTDGEGASALLNILDEAPGQRVFYARGHAVLRFFPDVSGEALVHLTSRYEEADGIDLAHGHLTVYARLDNRFLGGLLRVLIPFVGWVLDQKIAKAFLSESRAVELLVKDPATVLARLEEREPALGADVAAFRALLQQVLARRPGWTATSREARASSAGPAPAAPDSGLAPRSPGLAVSPRQRKKRARVPQSPTGQATMPVPVRHAVEGV